MKQTYLEVTFRRGRPVAAYYYLPRRPGQKSYRTVKVQPAMVVDLDRNGRPIGIEMTAPSLVSPAVLNRVLKQYGLPTAKRADLAPLIAA